MLSLHVWGSYSQSDKNGSDISIISPECVASSWLLVDRLGDQEDVKYEIVTSSNTNLSDIGKLPVLITAESKFHGFNEISGYLFQNFQSSSASRTVATAELTHKQQLINSGLLAHLQHKIEYINQYNLYINTKNYEKYTRKLFQHYLPFPMMYNQPLKFYNHAQTQIQVLGLNKNKTGFFDFSGNIQDDVAETELVNEGEDDEDEKDEVALSALHERQLLAKSKEKSMLRESKNSLKCLQLLDGYLTFFLKLSDQSTANGGEYGYLFSGKGASSSEVLLFAYIYCLTHQDLPDRFIYNLLRIKRAKFLEFADGHSQKWNDQLLESDVLRAPTGEETPGLWNEIKYRSGFVKY
ncbi:Tom37 C-terminal domain-containing protein [Scheffersomyces xylosifermentans]|uniref:Tom37 C-terminal domain-containing protein n=1 Tax=Scheffersomyces xylosifermentans TaxID=1304137 RepID=UPI00315D4FE7